jgi:hypothetical protein
MRIRLFWSGALLFVALCGGRVACAQQGCTQSSEVWNGNIGKTAEYFTNTCSRTVSITFLSGNNRKWSIQLLPNQRAFGLFYKEDLDGLGGVSEFDCFDPAYPVDGQDRPISTAIPDYSCKLPS